MGLLDCQECGGSTYAPRTVCTSCAGRSAHDASVRFRLHLLSCRPCIERVVTLLPMNHWIETSRLGLCPDGEQIRREARDWKIVAGLMRTR